MNWKKGVTMSRVVIDFLSTPCRNVKHSECHQAWKGLGFQFICECACHWKKYVADGFQGPDSAASSQYHLEVTKANDQ